MQSVTLTNLITNPLFSSGSGWTGYDGVSGGVMYKTSSGWGGFGASTAVPDISGHKYYFATSTKVSNASTDTRNGLGLSAGGGGVFEAWDLPDNTTGFLRRGIVRTSGATRSIYPAVYIPSATATRIDCNGMLYVDLTACFGAGNEPPVEWCDLWIPFFSGTQVIVTETTNSLKFYKRTRFCGAITGV